MSSLTFCLHLVVTWTLPQCTDNGHTAVTGAGGHTAAGPAPGGRVLCAEPPTLDRLGKVHLTHNLRLPFGYSAHVWPRHAIPVRHS